MPGRRMKAKEFVRKVIEQCAMGKMVGDSGLTDYDPLVVVLAFVTEVVEEQGKSMAKPKVQKAWLRIVSRIQDGDGCLEHNVFIPCRNCDQAFEPVVDETLLKLFMAWRQSLSSKDLVAIHRCPSCGGTIGVKRMKRYEADGHTPEPVYAGSDEEWAELLLQHCQY